MKKLILFSISLFVHLIIFSNIVEAIEFEGIGGSLSYFKSLSNESVSSFPNLGVLVELGAITPKAKELKVEISAEYNVLSYVTPIFSSYNLRDWEQTGNTEHSESDLFLNGTLKIPLLAGSVIMPFLGSGITFVRAKWETVNYYHDYWDSDTTKNQGTDYVYALHVVLGTDIPLEKFLKFFIKIKGIAPIHPSGNSAIQIIGGFVISPINVLKNKELGNTRRLICPQF